VGKRTALAAMAVAVAALAAGAPAEGTRVSANRGADNEQLERGIAVAINSLRRRHRLRPLRVAAPLARAGDAHARALARAGLFTHDWPDGRPLIRWMPAFYSHRGYRSWTVGENLLWSTVAVTPESAVSMWLSSPPHRRLILTGSWRQIGVGVVYAERAPGAYGGQDVYVVAAEFGTRG
jgi:uncharacterized protein YkwD